MRFIALNTAFKRVFTKHFRSHCPSGLPDVSANLKIVHFVTDLCRGELSYLAPLGSENISTPYFKQCFFQGGVLPLPPD